MLIDDLTIELKTMLIYGMIKELSKYTKDILFIVRIVSDQNGYFKGLPEDLKQEIVREVLSIK